MPSPFPGMDPYLERHRWFHGLHNDLNFCLQEALQPMLPQPYFALTGELIWREGSERYVEPDVDVLRPVSARRHRDMEGEEEAGVATLVAEAVEEPVVVTAGSSTGDERTVISDYHVSIYRFDRPQVYLVYPIPVERRLPVIRISLLPGDPAVSLDLQAVLQRAYDAGPYRRAVRYGEDVIDPPLPSAQAAWAAQLVVPVATPK